MSDETPKPKVRPRRRISSVWLVPLVALGLASWLVWQDRTARGPLATVFFETAEGISTGKTEVRCRSVKVGIVENVRLSDDLDGVRVELRIDSDYEDLLKRDSRFWVVRPRVSTSAVSGLGTLITVAYIELDPAESGPRTDYFAGLEEPPVTPANVPGLRLSLVAEDAGSLSVGAPIYHRGYEVGRVERTTLDTEADGVRFDIFIEKEYASLVRSSSRFWNNSGIEVSAGTEGFKFRTPTVQSLVTGGASFSTPSKFLDAPPAENDMSFTLHRDEEAALSTFEADLRLLLLFAQSVRGLRADAPVEFRGIPLGRVVDISLDEVQPGDRRIPVIIELDSNAFRRASALGRNDEIDLAGAVEAGLRARLATASLITGALYIDLDIFPDAPPATVGQRGEYQVIPTISSGLAQLEVRVNAILAKIEKLPLEESLASFQEAADETALTLAESRNTMTELENTLAEVRGFIADDSTREIPENLNKTLAELQTSIESLGPGGPVQGDLRLTLDELRSALRAFETLSNTIDEKPNSLLFGRESSGDPIPKARR
jgi:paraquat-inducible protein B